MYWGFTLFVHETEYHFLLLCSSLLNEQLFNKQLFIYSVNPHLFDLASSDIWKLQMHSGC